MARSVWHFSDETFHFVLESQLKRLVKLIDDKNADIIDIDVFTLYVVEHPSGCGYDDVWNHRQ